MNVVFLFLCCLSSTLNFGVSNTVVPKFTDVVQQVFDGNLDGLVVNGDVTARSKTDLSLESRFTVKRDDVGVEVHFKIENKKCDYQNFEITYGGSVIVGARIKQALDVFCLLDPSNSVCSDTTKVTVAEETINYNLLLPNGDVVDEIVLDTKNLTSVAAPIKSALEFLGADIKLKILNPKLMVAGMNFSINLNAAAFTPGSGVCSLPGSPCTNLVFNVSNVNLGKEILAWLRTNNNNYKNGEPLSWLQDDGTFVIGADSLSCLPTPGAFSFNLNGGDLAGVLGDTDSIRKALSTLANECLPDGYSVSDNVFQNISVSQNADGSYSVSGLAYSGAAKDAAGVLATVRQCMEENGWDFSINGKTAKVSGFAGDENCIASRKASNSNVCNSGKPPSSQMVDGGALGGSTLTKRGGFDTVEVVIITIVVTLSIVFAGYIGHKKFMARRAVGDISSPSNIDDVDHMERNSIFALHANPVTAGKVSGGGDAPHSISAGKQRVKPASEPQFTDIGGSSWEDVAIAKRNSQRKS